MKRYLFVIFCTLFVVTSVTNAQRREYDYSCGNMKGCVVTNVQPNANGLLNVTIDNNGVVSELVCEPDFKCIKCHISDRKSGNEISYVLNDGVYTVIGTVGGKKINAMVKSKGKPWYQNLSVSIGKISRKEKIVEFESFRAFEPTLAVMQARIIGEDKVGDHNVLDVRVSPTGALAKMWHGDFYVDSKDFDLIKYSSIEGAPLSTPRTTWILK